MVRQNLQLHTIQSIEPIPQDLVREPLEFLFAEHYRHRQMCRALEQLAVHPVFDATALSEVEAFIARDLADHVRDEEEDLFPLLRRRCAPEDEIDAILQVLSEEHEADERLAAAAREVLKKAMVRGVPIPMIEGGPLALQHLAEQERRHLALENAVVMPIARLRLNAADKEALSRALAERRGQTAL
jgi:iron-sulfur cluster repair protein YtfE (RIC family)